MFQASKMEKENSKSVIYQKNSSPIIELFLFLSIKEVARSPGSIFGNSFSFSDCAMLYKKAT